MVKIQFLQPNTIHFLFAFDENKTFLKVNTQQKRNEQKCYFVLLPHSTVFIFNGQWSLTAC